MEVVVSEVRHHKPKKTSFKKYLQEDDFGLLFLRFFGIVGIIFSIIACFTIGINLKVVIVTIFIMYLASFLAITLSSPEMTMEEIEKEVVIPNETNKKYLLHLGNEVKKFYGNAVKSGKKRNNQTRPILVDAETAKRHFLCMATVGAGKSVLMKGLIEQCVIAGCGCMAIDGKGTDEFAKEIYGLVASLGREDDFFHLNFLDMENTHTINPLASGSALSIYEVLIILLVGEENEWKAKQKEFMKNLLKIMVYKRDNEDFLLNFSEMQKVMNLTSLTKLAIKYKHLVDVIGIKDFIIFISSSIECDYEDFLKGNPNDKKWVDEMIKKSQNSDSQGVYDAGVSVGAWRDIMTDLGSDYGKVFNAPNPDISLWEATQRNKIIFVTLPTMDSDTTPRMLGKLILGLVKGVSAKKAKEADEPKIPFICYCDEIGSYISEGYGRLESKSRQIGVPMFPFFQSPAQIDVVAKNDYERKEMIDVTGIHILMKNMHPETTKFYNDFIPKKKVINRSYAERRQSAKGQGSVEDTYQYEEKEAIDHSEVINMNNGEMMVFGNGKMYRTIACSETTLRTKGKKIIYEKLSGKKIPLTQHIPKDKFFKEINNILDDDLRKLVNL